MISQLKVISYPHPTGPGLQPYSEPRPVEQVERKLHLSAHACGGMRLAIHISGDVMADRPFEIGQGFHTQPQVDRG